VGTAWRVNGPRRHFVAVRAVEVAGKNKVGGVIVRTDGCEATSGAMSFAPCDVQTGVCGDLEPAYQIPQGQGTQDPRVIYNQYDQCASVGLEPPLDPRRAPRPWCSRAGW
jgi:hypothetical protein